MRIQPPSLLLRSHGLLLLHSRLPSGHRSTHPRRVVWTHRVPLLHVIPITRLLNWLELLLRCHRGWLELLLWGHRGWLELSRHLRLTSWWEPAWHWWPRGGELLHPGLLPIHLACGESY